MYINHITITSGHIARTSRSDVSDEVLAIVSPWLKKIINTEEKYPLPVAELSNYSAIAYVIEGGLLMTVYGSFSDGSSTDGTVPLVTFGVAHKSRQSEPLWAMMLANFEHDQNIKQPSTPWCAVAIHSTIILHPDALSWIGDFERCVAWAWITRNPNLDLVKN